MSDSYEKPLIDTEDFSADEEADHSLGHEAHTMESRNKTIQVLSNRLDPVQSDANTPINSLPSSGRPPPLRRTDSSASLGSRIFASVASKIAAGSIKGSIFTMCISIVGAGALSLPYALRNVGLVLGLILVFFCACLAYFTLDLLLISAEYLPEVCRGPKPLRDISYQSLAKHSYGNWLSRSLQVLMAIQYFGSMIAYVVAFSGFFDLVYSIYPHPAHWPDSIYVYCVIGICYGVVFPISLLRNVDSLRFTSLLGFSMSCYLVTVVTVEYFFSCSKGDEITTHYNTTCVWSDAYKLPSNVIWPLTSFQEFYKGFLTAWPLIVFAYTGHPFLLPLYEELARPNIRRIRKVFFRGMLIICALYVFIALFGFLLFLDDVCSNLLLNDFRKHIDVVLAALGIGLSCILTEPIFSYNFRRMIGMLVWNKSARDIPTFWHVVITFLFVSANVALGVAVKSIAIVFGFLGSTTYPLLGYILPAAFFVKMAPTEQYYVRKVLAVIQAVIVTVISLCSLAYKFYSPGDEDCDAAQSIG